MIKKILHSPQNTARFVFDFLDGLAYNKRTPVLVVYYLKFITLSRSYYEVTFFGCARWSDDGRGGIC